MQYNNSWWYQTKCVRAKLFARASVENDEQHKMAIFHLNVNYFSFCFQYGIVI